MKPSTLDIVETFKEEIPIVKQEIRKNKTEIRRIERWADKHLEQIETSDEFTKWFWAKALEILTPDEPYERLNRLQMMLRLCPQRGAKGDSRGDKAQETTKAREAYINRLKRIEGAKQTPIISLYPFEKVKRGPHRWTACCPIHGERTPSFVIYLDNNTWHCFGACGEGGDSIAFIMKLKGCDFNEALDILSP